MARSRGCRGEQCDKNIYLDASYLAVSSVTKGPASSEEAAHWALVGTRHQQEGGPQHCCGNAPLAKGISSWQPHKAHGTCYFQVLVTIFS